MNETETASGILPILSTDGLCVGAKVRLLKDIWDDGEDHHPPRFIARAGEVLIDCRYCGGSGCRMCKRKGTMIVAADRPAGLQMPRNPEAFEAARECCPCYQGYSINAGVAQCSHADATDGDFCSVERCPALTQND